MVDRTLTHQVKPETRVAYIMSRFPKISETFVLYEVLAVEKQGCRVELYPLQRERTKVLHPEAVPLVERAKFTPWISFSIVWSNLLSIVRQPCRYWSTLAIVLWANLGSMRFFTGAALFFPKAVHLARLMNTDGIEHIHAHFASHPAMVAFTINRFTGIPYSFTAHGSDLHRDQHMLREKVGQSSFVVAISDYNRQMIVEHCGPETASRVKVIHCGVDVEQFKHERATQQGSGAYRIICIGTIHEVKGQPFLVSACRQLSDEGRDYVLEFVGDGPELPQLRAQVESSGIADRVILHGRKNRHEIIELLRSADVLVTPSVFSSDGRREGIPVVLMEAMASGIPVVASEISGIPELVETEVTGLLTPPKDVHGLASALSRLLDDPELARRLSHAGRDFVTDNFNQQISAAQLADLFEARESEDPSTIVSTCSKPAAVRVST